MRGSHNIDGCEAIFDPRDRLVAFCHVHGSIRMLPRRRGPLVALALAFLAGAAGVLAAAAAVALLRT